MAISITHAFVSGIADGADATVVRPSNWNAALVTSMATAKLLGRATAATGAFEEITLGTNLSFTGTTLNAASGSATWDTIGAAAGSTTTANGTNNIVYNTAPTADSKVAWTFGETTAATNGTSTSGVPNQVLLKLATLAASTQSPLSVYSRGNHVFSVSPTTRQILAYDGSTAIPAYSFAGGTTDGMASSAGDLTVNASSSVKLTVSSSTYILCINNWVGVKAGTTSSPGLRDGSTQTTGLSWLGSNQVSITDTTFGEMLRFTAVSTTSSYFTQTGVTFSNLPAAANGSQLYCSDCDEPALVDTTCTSAGTKTGAFAKRLNGAWKCS